MKNIKLFWSNMTFVNIHFVDKNVDIYTSRIVSYTYVINK